jgi:DNA-binding transcriptional LysR family regulator
MQLETLKMFCDVVETGSFSQAARLNHVTQSAVSQQIRALEDRYAQKLLTRRAREATPTPAGERLYRGCREVLARFADLELEIREASGEVLGACTLSTIYSVGLHEMQPYVKQVLQKHPKLNVRLSYRRSAQVYEEVANGVSDLGVVAFPAAQPGLTILPFKEDSLALVLPPGHVLGSRQKVPLRALAGVEFIAFDRDAPTRKAIDRVLRGAGIDLRPTQELDNVETIKQAIELGLGVSILPRAAVTTEVAAGRLEVRPFADGNFSRPLGIVVRKDRFLSRAAAAVLEALTSPDAAG